MFRTDMSIEFNSHLDWNLQLKSACHKAKDFLLMAKILVQHVFPIDNLGVNNSVCFC